MTSLVKGVVFDVKRFAIHDGPGIRTTVFLKGCPLKCRWCHNPEGQVGEPELVTHGSRCIGCGACVDACPEDAIHWNETLPVTDRRLCTVCGACVEVCYAEARELAGREMTVGDVVAEVERDRAFYEESAGGVTLSGGEPLFQREFLLALLETCAERGIDAAVDTCGYCAWETLDAVRKYTGLFLYDLKLIDEARHRESTGASNRPILENLKALSQAGQTIILRVPVIPGVNDDAEEMRRIGEFAADLPALQRIDLLPYHDTAVEKYRRLDRAYPLTGVLPPSARRLDDVAEILRGLGLTVKIGG